MPWVYLIYNSMQIRSFCDNYFPGKYSLFSTEQGKHSTKFYVPGICVKHFSKYGVNKCFCLCFVAYLRRPPIRLLTFQRVWYEPHRNGQRQRREKGAPILFFTPIVLSSSTRLILFGLNIVIPQRVFIPEPPL